LYYLPFYFFFPAKKSENQDSVAESTTNLPNYGNVDLAKVFTPAESQVANKASLANYINSYYQKVWENGDLSGGILVAKGDNIIYENYRGLPEKEIRTRLIKIRRFMLLPFQKH
jgi:hypothetical protein